MKVAMVETGGWGGIAHYTWNLCAALSKAGAEVTLFTNVRYELEHLARTFTLERCVDGHCRYLQNIRTVSRRLSKFPPHIVHVQSLISTRFDACFWPLVRRKNPVVFTAHNVRSHEADIWGSWTLWRCLRKADAVVAHTQDSVEVVRRRLGSDAHIGLIHHGDYAFFGNGAVKDRTASRQVLDIPADARIVLIFGAIRPYKEIFGVISAFPRIRKRHPNAHLVIAGPLLVGSEEEYQEAITQAGVNGAVLFRPGYVPHDRVASYFAASDVALFNYRDVTDSGALRIACSQGTPVVATAVGGFREFLRNGITGRLIAPNNPDRLVDAVCEMLADPVGAEKMAKAALALGGSSWSWADSAEATLELYRNVLSTSFMDSRKQAQRGGEWEPKPGPRSLDKTSRESIQTPSSAGSHIWNSKSRDG